MFLPGEENIAKRKEVREKIRLGKLRQVGVPCSNCGNLKQTPPWRIKKYEHIFCNRQCKAKYMSRVTVGPKANNWRGGRIIDKDGYILELVPSHPYADNKGYVREHRLVVEKKLNRYLLPDEIVHHKDHDKQNNDPNNLILTDRVEHLSKYHRRK